MRKISSFSLFIFKDFKSRILLSLFCKLLLNFTKGISLLVLIPIISGSQELIGSDKINQFFRAFFAKLGYSASLNTFIIVILCLALIQVLLNYFVSILDVKLVEEFNFKLKSELNHKLLFADYLFYKKRKNAQINTVILNQIELLGFALNQLIQLLSKLINLLIYLIFASFISLKITLLVLVFLAVIFVLHKLIFKTSFQIGRQEYQVKEEEFNQLNDQITAIKEIKLKNRELYFSQKLNKIFKNYFVAQIRFMKLQNQSNLIYELISFFIFISVFVFFKLNFQTNVAEWIVLIYLLSRSLPLGSSISNSLMNIMNVLPSFQEFLNLKYEIVQSSSGEQKNSLHINVLETDIQVKNLKFSYPKSKAIFNDFSCEIKRNKINFLKGQSGKGKTSFIEILLGLLRADSGEIVVNTQNVLTERYFFTDLVYIPQETHLLNDTILANILFLNEKVTKQQILEFISKNRTFHFLLDLPQGLGTIIGENGIQLSGGERQRLSFLKAFLAQPNFLILDEASSAIDEENEQEIYNYIQKLGITVLLVSHRERLIQFAENTIHLE